MSHEQSSAEKRDAALAVVQNAGFAPVQMPNEWHYKVGRFDWWPTTGRFYDQRTGEGGYWVEALLGKLRRDAARDAEAREVEELKAEGKIV